MTNGQRIRKGDNTGFQPVVLIETDSQDGCVTSKESK